jgi:hypothetical protein
VSQGCSISFGLFLENKEDFLVSDFAFVLAGTFGIAVKAILSGRLEVYEISNLFVSTF